MNPNKYVTEDEAQTIDRFIEGVQKLAMDLGVPSYRCFAASGGLHGTYMRDGARVEHDAMLDLVINASMLAIISAMTPDERRAVEDTLQQCLDGIVTEEKSTDWPQAH